MASLADLDPLAALGIVGSRPAPGTLGYEELKRRQAIAAAMAGGRRREFPKTFGEGLTSLGEAVGERLNDDRITQMARAQRGAEGGVLKGAPGTLAPGVGGGLAVPPVAAAPVAAAPVAAPNTFGGRPYTEVPVRKSESEGDEGDLKDKLAALLLGNGAEVPSSNPMQGAEAPPLTTDMQALPTQEAGGPSSDIVAARRGAIGGIESGGRGDPYQALGAPTRGDRAYGKYQVMGNNIPEWTEAALGQRLTPAQFLASKEAQDAVFDHRFGQYAAKYGDEGAARAWYGGERGMKNLGATDVHGRLTVGGYGQDYMNRLRGQQPGGAQLASLGGAGGTMTDAPPPGAFRPPASDDPEPTPTDIKPMPVRTAQMGVPPSGVLPGASMMSSDFTRGAPPPSSQPIPPEPTEKSPVVRPEPKQPEIMGPTKAMEYWSRYMNNPNVSPELQAHAKRIYDTEAHYVKELQARRDANFVHERQQREAEQLRAETWEREAPVRKIDNHIKRLQIEKTLATTPLEVAKLNGEIKAQEIAREKAAYEITQRAAEEAQKATTLATGQRALAKPETEQIGGKPYERPYDPVTKTLGPLRPVAGSPTDDKLAENQAKTFKALQRATVAQSLIGEGNELRGLKDTVAGRVPIGGNYMLSPEYQSKYSAMMTWATAILRDESGAVLGPSEIATKLSTYFPVPGDSDKVVAEKTARRQAEEQSLYHSLGDKKHLVDQWREQRKSQKTDKPDGTIETSNKGRTRRVIGGHWVYPDEW